MNTTRTTRASRPRDLHEAWILASPGLPAQLRTGPRAT